MNSAESLYQIEKDILAAMKKPGKAYWIALGISFLAFAVGMSCWAYQIYAGMGVSGKTFPVGWFMYITNFVFWVGIAHSGTLISAILFLFRARYRNRFNRSAEAMTIIAIMVAGLFPLIHLGRTWFFYWLMPYPNQRQIWQNFRSPLMWDVFAVSTYFTVSLIFFYMGMVPDLSVVRRYATGMRKWIYSRLSLGWTGTEKQWHHYNQLYLFLAAFATPLVVSVHSVVSWDFAMSVLPGWHSTIFAPYFVAGAIFSGTAMVLTLVIPMRKIFSLEKYITPYHFEQIAKILLFTSLIVSYSYIVEYALANYSGNIYEIELFRFRLFGTYRYFTYLMLFCNSILPLTIFIPKLRQNLWYLFALSIMVNVGMWFERLVIIITSLGRDFDPYAWGQPVFSFVALGIHIGAFGMFFMLYLLFAKLLPILSMNELKEQYHSPQ